MKKLIFIIILFSILGNVSTVYGGGLYSLAFDAMAHKQGWLIGNDYKTKMNPPSCKSREPDAAEIEKLNEICKDDSTCSTKVNEWVKGWDINNCKKLGMKVRRTSEGQLESYFPSEEIPSSATPKPTIETEEIIVKQTFLQSIIERLKKFIAYIQKK